MEIKFHGHACFSIKDGKTVIVTDPYDESIGLKMPKLTANVVTISFDSKAHSAKDVVDGNPMVLNWPGEYETLGVHFKGIHSFHNTKEDKEQLENVIFTINFNGIRFCHLGAQGTKLTPEQLEQVGDVDVLFVPAGKTESVDAKKAKEIIEQIEPRIIIPMTYHTEGSNRNLASLEEFLSVMAAKNTEPVDSFVVKKSELPEDNSKVVVLESAN
ncbi:MBL fold metallo-hydrolase [Patescibacteria group bacterium]|nr:MBL fold metallo-hydrolase [Patescibacteria group bacterium]MBU1683278.1 MBL fold metallo-hydrolase [Patescibacteria group bacterium]MBU1935709.1 MBL fold metallo-hydrolase [Patescibacteria group bacterium]